MTDDMCPNCLTPWKCNGPHIVDTTGRTTPCQNCGKSQILCDADHYLDRRSCCRSCEHPRKQTATSATPQQGDAT